MANFDKWTILKLVEVLFVLACLVIKRVTDDEARSVFLYLRKLSREWTLLNNITWDRVGASVADTAFGGYLIITIALFVGRIIGEIPTQKRITELILLGVGAILFIVIGSLAYAALDSVPHDLIDNAAILGTVALVTGFLFLLDMGGPKGKKTAPETLTTRRTSRVPEIRNIPQQINDIEKQIENSERTDLSNGDQNNRFKLPEHFGNGVQNGGGHQQNGMPKKKSDTGKPSQEVEMTTAPTSKSYTKPSDPIRVGYKPMVEDDFDLPQRYGVFGKDAYSDGGSLEERVPPKMEQHSPVWSNIRKGRNNHLSSSSWVFSGMRG